MTCLNCTDADYWWSNSTHGECRNCSVELYYDAATNDCIACPDGNRYNRSATEVRTG